MTNTPPLLIEPHALQQLIGNDQLMIIDMSPTASYSNFHIPGAVSLNYDDIVTSQPPVMGLLPDAATLSRIFSNIGLQPQHHVVAYDNESGGKACRLLWTLDCIGHSNNSLLNGGLTAWSNAGMPMNNQVQDICSSHYEAKISDIALADKTYLLEHLNNPSVVIVDTRSEHEYNGSVVRAARGGHIPGAVHIDWVRTISADNDLRLRSHDELLALYEPAGISKDKQIITYCHTHHRSAHSYIVLKTLGYPYIKGYHGAWSEWGNAEDTPIEQ